MSEQKSAKCIICDKPTALQCAKCKTVAYCSRECQKTDWKVHKLICSEAASLTSLPHPYGLNASIRTAIFFPEDQEKPRFVKIREINNVFVTTPFLGVGVYGSTHMQSNPIRERPFDDYTLVFLYRDAFMKDGSKLNRAMSNATGGRYSHSWRGPILAVKRIGFDLVYHEEYCDIEPKDFRDVVDFFLSHRYHETVDFIRRWTERTRDDEINAVPRTQGVIVACDGDQEVSGYPKYIEVNLPKSYPAFTCEPSPISRLFELPIVTFQLHVENWKFADQRWKFQNLTGTFLNIKPEDGFADLKWQMDVGNIVVVRKDAKPLTAELLEILFEFHRGHLIPLFETWFDGSEKDGRKKLDESMTKEGFLRFFHNYRKKMIANAKASKNHKERARWEKVVSPYESWRQL